MSSENITYPLHILNTALIEGRPRYYIDCPVDSFPACEVKRVEIPRALAVYIEGLQTKIKLLSDKVDSEKENRDD